MIYNVENINITFVGLRISYNEMHKHVQCTCFCDNLEIKCNSGVVLDDFIKRFNGDSSFTFNRISDTTALLTFLSPVSWLESLLNYIKQWNTDRPHNTVLVNINKDRLLYNSNISHLDSSHTQAILLTAYVWTIRKMVQNHGIQIIVEDITNCLNTIVDTTEQIVMNLSY